MFTVKANMPTLHEKLKSLPWAEVPATRQTKVVANVVLFVPFGLYIGLLAPSWPSWKVAGAVAGTSLVLEVAQYVLAVGSSDVTDVLVNTAGGLAGIGLLALARRGLRARTTTVMTRVCSIGTVLALLASGIFFASPLRYAPPRGTPQSLSRSVPVQMPGHTRGERPRLKGTPRPS